MCKRFIAERAWRYDLGVSDLMGRALIVAGVAAALVAISAIVVVTILRGGPSASLEGVTGLIALVGTLATILINLIQTSRLTVGQAAQTKATQELTKKVNGHLQAHVGHTDAQLDQRIDARLAEAQKPPSDQAPG